MKSYLSLIPISAKVRKRQNRMTVLCIIISVFLVTAIFSVADMMFRMEQARLVGKHGSFSIGDLLGSSMGQTLLSVAVVLFRACNQAADDTSQQHEQQRCTENPIFRNDALHWYE